MPEKTILETIKEGTILVSDGAWGTFLQNKGLKAGECPELWCIERPDDVKDIAKSYIEAGSDMVETNSFGGTSYKLDHFGLADKVGEINEAAARLSCEAAGKDNWVIASIGPSGKMTAMGDVTEQEFYNSFKEQACALEKGGAHAICIETMSALDEAIQAVKAVKENTECEIICTFTFEKTVQGDYKTMMGITPADFALKLTEAGADIIGANCGNGIERMIDIVKEIKQAVPESFVLVHANAGMPKNINGVDIFPEDPEQMASRVPELIKAGVNIIGGCCGTTPEHIKAMKQIINP